MSDKRDLVRDRIIQIQNKCFDITINDVPCSKCPNDHSCTFLIAFDDWRHMLAPWQAGDEDLERLVDDVMTVDDYEDLLEINDVKLDKEDKQ